MITVCARLLLPAAMILLLAAGATATIRSVPNQYSTIQAAIEAAVQGDTVLVSPGRYYENIRLRGKAITVASTWLTTGDTTRIGSTIIDGSRPVHPDSGSAVFFIAGEDTTSILAGFTITGGTGTLAYYDILTPEAPEQGAGTRTGGRTASPVGAWARHGGGVLCSNSGAKLVRNVITRNFVTHNRLAMGGGVEAVNTNTGIPIPTVVLLSNTFLANVTKGIGSNGEAYSSGADFWGTDFRVFRNVFERDTAEGVSFGVGGGMGIYSVQQTIRVRGVVEGNIFRRNVVLAQERGAVGAGIYAWGVVQMTVRGNLFDGNAGRSLYGWAQGGGLFLDDNGVTDLGWRYVVGNRFVNNWLTRGGGTERYCGAGIMLSMTLAEIDGNVIADNVTNGGGGGIAVYQASFYAINNVITRNQAYYGGGLSVNNSTAMQSLVNNTVTDNVAAAQGGGMSTPRITAMNNIFWGNTAPNFPQIEGTANVFNCDVQGGWIGEGTGNIDVPPRLVAATFALSDSSGCIGRGIDSVFSIGRWHFAPRLCHYGSSRPNPPGSRPDIGACENPRANPLIGVDELGAGLPVVTALDQNYPNPFNPGTAIRYALPARSHATLTVFNTLGQQVAILANGEADAGSHEVRFNASGLPSGVYFYRLTAGAFTETKRMLLLR